MNEGKKLINRAMEFAHAAHDSIGQKRKYPPQDPYWVHTDRVAALVEQYHGKPSMVAAAHLHDVLEDVEPELIKQGRIPELRNFQYVYGGFPNDVRLMVSELTHIYTAEAYPGWSRKKRKLAEVARLATATRNSKSIKLADLIDNSSSIVEHDPDFARVYLDEKALMLEVLKGGNHELWNLAYKVLKEALDKLGLS